MQSVAWPTPKSVQQQHTAIALIWQAATKVQQSSIVVYLLPLVLMPLAVMLVALIPVRHLGWQPEIVRQAARATCVTLPTCMPTWVAAY